MNMILTKIVCQSVFYAALTAMLLMGLSCAKNASNPEPDYAMPALHTDGRWILDEHNEKVLLRGVNIPGLEWDANESHVLQSFYVAVDLWHCNLIRLPLAQDRWYGYGSEQNDTGVRYRAMVDQLVELALDRKIYLWLDLHWSNGGHWGYTIGQHKMPDQHSLTFWKELASRYKNHPAVLFGLYNEPYDISWNNWQNGGMINEHYDRGGETADLTYLTVGHQQLVDEIRSTGAENPIIAGGIDWGYDLSGILRGYALKGSNLIYDTHPYPWKNTNWDYRWISVADSLPVIVGEWGDSEENDTYFNRIRQVLIDHSLCWATWCFHASAGPQMLADWDYTPTYFGEIVKEDLETEVRIEEDAPE
jgi:endoglucanase